MINSIAVAHEKLVARVSTVKEEFERMQLQLEVVRQKLGNTSGQTSRFLREWLHSESTSTRPSPSAFHDTCVLHTQLQTLTVQVNVICNAINEAILVCIKFGAVSANDLWNFAFFAKQLDVVTMSLLTEATGLAEKISEIEVTVGTTFENSTRLIHAPSTRANSTGDAV